MRASTSILSGHSSSCQTIASPALKTPERGITIPLELADGVVDEAPSDDGNNEEPPLENQAVVVATLVASSSTTHGA